MDIIYFNHISFRFYLISFTRLQLNVNNYIIHLILQLTHAYALILCCYLMKEKMFTHLVLENVA